MAWHCSPVSHMRMGTVHGCARRRRWEVCQLPERTFKGVLSMQAGGGPTGTELAAELNDLVSVCFLRMQRALPHVNMVG